MSEESDSGGPVLFEELMDRATGDLQVEVEEFMVSEASKAAHDASHWVCGLIRKAYAEGVRDGYVQGVQKRVTGEEAT